MPSLLYVYNMLPVIGAGDRFTDISIVPHPKGFRKVVEKVLQLRKGPLCEGTPAKRVGRDLTWRHFMKMSLPQSASLTAIFNLLVVADACIGPRGGLPFAGRGEHRPLQPLRKVYRALISVQKPTDKSRLFLYDIDEVCDFPVSELAIPTKMV